MRKLLLLLLAALITAPLGAVLKERDLARTLSVLRAELEMTYHKQELSMQRFTVMQESQHTRLVEYMQSSEQIALMLYSQHNDYTFDLTYACQQATDLYNELSKKTFPYALIQKRVSGELTRYDGLIKYLENLPPRVKIDSRGRIYDPLRQHHAIDSVDAATIARIDSIADGFGLNETTVANARDSIIRISNTYRLTPEQRADRDACLQLAFKMRGSLAKFMEEINADNLYYTTVSGNVRELYEYAQDCYGELRQNIFTNGGDNYFTTLLNLGHLLPQALDEITSKYDRLDGRAANFSEWRGPVVQFIVVVLVGWGLLSAFLSSLLLRYVPRRFRPSDFEAKHQLYHIVTGIFIFALAVMVIRVSLQQHFVLMAANLVVSIAWLTFAIFLSLLVRIRADQRHSSIRLYLPNIVMAGIVIVFRMLFVPNNVVNLVYPPILLACTFWQLQAMRAPKSSITSNDILYSTISMTAFVVSTILAWSGYVLFAVEIMVWWMFQLAAFQTITCLYYLFERYERHFVLQKISKDRASHGNTGEDCRPTSEKDWQELQKRARLGEYIQHTFIFDFLVRALVPILLIISGMMSLWYAADIFEMTDMLRDAFYYNFVDKANIVQLSLHKIVIVACCWFIFRYLNYLLRSLYRHIQRLRTQQNPVHLNFTLSDNIIAILVWGSFVLYALYLLQVPKTGLSVVTAGLATGLGFAMKDLLENFFYGISLMTGRVRVGDYIECDGIQGRVESITYQSTQLITLDGSVIAFLNTQLFSKNFKNLTRNHHYELVKIPIGVAYGSDIQQVRQMLVEAIRPVIDVRLDDGRNVLKTDSAISVVFSDFGASSVDLLVCYWILVDQKSQYNATVKETIYNVLTQRGIEIPFPQCDVHLSRQ